MPHYPCEFEIPDSWLAEAGMMGFNCMTPAFRSTADAVLVALTEIEPPYRLMTHPKDWHGFDQARLVRLLNRIATGAEIDAVPLLELPFVNDYSQRPYRYRVRDGYHRFFASVAVGFKCLPGLI